MELNKKTLRTIFLGVAGCIVLYWLLHETQRVSIALKGLLTLISPFLVGAAIAFVLNVPLRFFEGLLKGISKPKPRRALSILLTLLSVLLVLTGVVYLVIPQVIETVETLILAIPEFITRVTEEGMAWLDKNPQILKWLQENTDFATTDWFGVIQQVLTEFGNWLASLLDQLSTVVDQAFTALIAFGYGIFNAIMSFVFALYCLGNKERLAWQGRQVLYAFLPERFCDETVRILRMTNSAFSNFISGQCLEAVILGAMFMVSMTVFRMPFMPLVSVIITVTALVPIVGAFVGCVLGAFFILVVNPTLAFWFVIMFLVLQQIEGNLIYPRVVGTSIGLPGMWVLVAVTVGGDLMGVGGMLLMIPLTSVIYALIREGTEKQLAKRQIDESKLRIQAPEINSKFKEKRQQRKQHRMLLKLERKSRKQK